MMIPNFNAKKKKTNISIQVYTLVLIKMHISTYRHKNIYENEWQIYF